MKTKSFLVAVFSVLAMIAYADTFSCASRVILPEGFVIGPGETDASFWPVVLYREGDYTDNFTNLQINIFLPDGLNVIDCVSHNDTKFYNEDTGEEQQALNLTTLMAIMLSIYRTLHIMASRLRLPKTPLLSFE